MNPFLPTLYTTVPLVEKLKSYGGHIYELSESYKPVHASVSLREPLSPLTPANQFNLRQWLVDAGPALQISLQSGLLHWGGHCLYESNLQNKTRIQGSISAFLHRPPGYWHRYRAPISSSEPLTLLSSHNNPNYFHWLTQPGFASLFLQEHFGLRPFSTVALSHRPRRLIPNFVPELLDVFATGKARIYGVALTSSSLARFAIQDHGSEVVVSPAQVHWLHRRCRDFLKPAPKPWRKLYISRRRTLSRRCLNENHIITHLKRYGFEAICLEDFTVMDQLRIFSESILVVGAHGAGFSNLIACTSQAAIIELLPRPGSFTHYYAMADILGLTHGHLMATRCDPETDDFTISPDDLIELLWKMKLL